MGRSKWLPDFGISDGDKFMMIFCAGKEKFNDKSADFTRSALSLIEAPASPTILSAGKPRLKLDSTSTSRNSSL